MFVEIALFSDRQLRFCCSVGVGGVGVAVGVVGACVGDVGVGVVVGVAVVGVGGVVSQY